MTFSRIKIGLYKLYYQKTLLLYLNTSNNFNNINWLTSTSMRVRHIKNYILTYPILYKKIFFLQLTCILLKKRNSGFLNLNQTIIFEGFITNNKCILSLPIYSFVHKIRELSY